MGDGYEEAIAFWDKEAGAGSKGRVDLSGVFVSVCVTLFDDVDLTGTTDCINTMAFTVVENVVAIAGDIDLCNHVARIGIEHDKLGGNSAADKQSMVPFIKGHGEVSEG